MVTRSSRFAVRVVFVCAEPVLRVSLDVWVGADLAA